MAFKTTVQTQETKIRLQEEQIKQLQDQLENEAENQFDSMQFNALNNGTKIQYDKEVKRLQSEIESEQARST